MFPCLPSSTNRPAAISDPPQPPAARHLRVAFGRAGPQLSGCSPRPLSRGSLPSVSHRPIPPGCGQDQGAIRHSRRMAQSTSPRITSSGLPYYQLGRFLLVVVLPSSLTTRSPTFSLPTADDVQPPFISSAIPFPPCRAVIWVLGPVRLCRLVQPASCGSIFRPPLGPPLLIARVDIDLFPQQQTILGETSMQR